MLVAPTNALGSSTPPINGVPGALPADVRAGSSINAPATVPAGGALLQVRPNSQALQRVLVASSGAAQAAQRGQPPRARVIVIDVFDTKTVNLDRGNTVPDASHGQVVALIAEGALGRPVERIDVGNGQGGIDDQRFSAALQALIRSRPDGDYTGLVLSISLGYNPDSFRGEALVVKRQLIELAQGGAQIFLAAGNEYENALASPYFTTVGASDGVVGQPLDTTPAKGFVQNLHTDVIRNGRLMSQPEYDQSGKFLGVRVTPSPSSPLFPEGALTDVSSRIRAIEGRTLAQSQLQRPEVAAFAAGFAGRTLEQFTQALVPHESSVIALDDANAVLASAGNPPIPKPLGTDRQDMFVSAIGVFVHLVQGGRSPQVVFFTVDRAGLLRPLSNDGPTQGPRGTSFSVPQMVQEPPEQLQH
jgi:hypothetical protein